MRLWGIADEPFWPALNGSWSSPISVCWRLRISVANRSRLPPTMAIAVRSAAWRSRWTIWVLAGSAWSPSSARTSASTSGPRWLYVPTGPGDLARPDLVDGDRQAAPPAVELERPAGELQAERDRLGVDRVGPAHHQRLGLRPGAGDRAPPGAGRSRGGGAPRRPAAGGRGRCRRRRCSSGRDGGSGPRGRPTRRPGRRRR